jgi:vesicle-associated membrane protein 7
MSIIYALISRGDVVLTEYAAARGNFIQVTRDLIKRIDPFTTRKMSYSYDDRIHYHIMVESGVIYLCMADSEFAKRRAYSFLVDVKNLFISQYGDTWQTAIALQFDNQFSRTLQRRADYFSNDPNSDKITAIKTEVEAAKNVVTENIEKLIERGEKIELLVDKTNQLTEESYQFKDKAKKMKMKFWWKNIKFWVILGALAVIVVFLIIWFACGFPAFQTCTGKKPAPK